MWMMSSSNKRDRGLELMTENGHKLYTKENFKNLEKKKYSELWFAK